MCGRFVVTENDRFYPYFRVSEAEAVDMNWSYNLAPSQYAGTVIKDEKGINHIQAMKWGLQPEWAAKSDSKIKPINARSESATEKPFFKSAIKKRRCIVPATGFFEWKKTKEGKEPHYIRIKDNPYMSLAGIYEVWEDSEGKPHYSFALMTVGANKFMKGIHDRMPAIINGDEEKWLSDEELSDAELKKILDKYDSKEMEEYEVSKDVNSPKNNSKEIIVPI